MPDPPSSSLPLAAVVINPTKFDDVGAARREIDDACRRRGWQRPLWFETTVDDPGVGQARQAIDEGATVIMACGGDGTVRCVSQSLASSGVPLGLLPAGTGNLLARNLELDLDDLDGAVGVALSGVDRGVDVAWARTDIGEAQAFLVMGGVGFDAQIMDAAPEALKARVGLLAYFVGGIRHLAGKHARVKISLPGGVTRIRRVRSVVVGNCGRLIGGLALIPDAEFDDGHLDVVAVSPSDIFGWGSVILEVVTRSRLGRAKLEHWTTTEVTLETSQPQPAQLDGDTIGDCTTFEAHVEHKVLLVRVPSNDPRH